MSGTVLSLQADDASLIANSSVLDGAAYAELSEDGRDCVIALLQAGHYRLALADEEE